jgi:hypothetical protein
MEKAREMLGLSRIAGLDKLSHSLFLRWFFIHSNDNGTSAKPLSLCRQIFEKP